MKPKLIASHTGTFYWKKEIQRIVSYNLTETILVFLLFLRWWKEKHAAITASVSKQNWKLRDTKINIASLIPLQMTKSHKFWVPEYFLYQCTLLIKIQPKGSTIIFTSKFFCSETLLDDLRLARWGSLDQPIC